MPISSSTIVEPSTLVDNDGIYNPDVPPPDPDPDPDPDPGGDPGGEDPDPGPITPPGPAAGQPLTIHGNTRVPLELTWEVTTPSGRRYRWDANRTDPGERPLGVSFSSKLGEGFSSGTLRLPRRIESDLPDLRLLNTVTATGADGTVAFEGRIEAIPREIGDTHAISVTLAGWIAHTKDKRFSEIYVDRDLGSWGGTSVARRQQRIAEGGGYIVSDGSSVADPGTNLAALQLSLSNDTWLTTNKPHSEIVYDAGPGNRVSRLHYEWTKGGFVDAAQSAFEWSAWIMADPTYSRANTSGNLRGAGPGSGNVIATATDLRYAALQFFATDAYGTANAKDVWWHKLAVYGGHNVPLRFGEPGEPEGVSAADVIRDITRRHCPQLDPSGVRDTTYVIQHLAFKDPVFPYDAFLELNKYHLWNFGVWENRRLVFEPFDLTDYDWEVRTDMPGVTWSAQGSSTQDLFNGIVVTYTDVLSGTRNRLTPLTHTELRDRSEINPWNENGIDKWDEITLSTPTTLSTAVQLGRAALAEKNRPKAPGTITVRGYIRDRAGHDQPVWKVRAGQTIAITSAVNDRPRLIHEASYNADTQTVTINVDAPAPQLDAVIDRTNNALQARNLI